MPTHTVLMLGSLALLGVSLALLAPVALVAWWQRRQDHPSKAEWRARQAELARCAELTAQRARQAARGVELASEKLIAAEQARAEAWTVLEQAQQARQQADQAHQRVLRAQAGRSGDSGTQREVASAALAAYRRGHLSQEELWRVWRWGSGWDPEQERCERELASRRLAHRDAQLRYRAAAAAERAARQATEVAWAQARALADEATTTAAEASRPE